MVYKAGDIKHLETMESLGAAQPQEIDIKSLLNLNASQDPSFEENILKLCDGLRAQGFDKYAHSLEEKFLALKQAEVHLYKVHEEDGEDLIDSAHPEGDTNMGDGDLGDVETIVSRHNKIVDIVKKTPTGKLASYVEQCKIALGDESVLQQYQESFNSRKAIALRQAKLLDAEVKQNGDLHWYGSLGAYKYSMENLLNHLQSLDQEQNGIPNLDKAIFNIEQIIKAIQGNAAVGGVVNPFAGVSENVLQRLDPIANDIKFQLNEMKRIALKMFELQTAQPAAGGISYEPMPELVFDPEQRAAKTQELLETLKNLKSKYSSKANALKLTSTQQAPVLSWFAAEEKEINSVKTQKNYDDRRQELNDFSNKIQ